MFRRASGHLLATVGLACLSRYLTRQVGRQPTSVHTYFYIAVRPSRHSRRARGMVGVDSIKDQRSSFSSCISPETAVHYDTLLN